MCVCVCVCVCHHMQIRVVISLLRDNWCVARIFGLKQSVSLQKGPHHYITVVRGEDWTATSRSDPCLSSHTFIFTHLPSIIILCGFNGKLFSADQKYEGPLWLCSPLRCFSSPPGDQVAQMKGVSSQSVTLRWLLGVYQHRKWWVS